MAVDSGGNGIEELARAGLWEQALSVAVRRDSQLPLRPEEALIAAHAAGRVGNRDARRRFLGRVVDDPDLGAVARVELAQMIGEEAPEAALDLVLPLLRKGPSRELRRQALAAASAAVEAGVGREARTRLERQIAGVSKRARRGVELALARTAHPPDKTRLKSLIAASTRDLVALDAAELLAAGTPDPVERWLIAQTYYRHGLFERAAPLLEELAGVRHSRVPAREVAYLRGRCAFRRGDWATAERWYARAIGRASGDRRAEIEVHLGRTLELAGDLDGAVAAAQRAVRIKTTDDRRLFLARLRLRRGEPELARFGIDRLRSRSNRARGELMIGLDELKRGAVDAAISRLSKVSRDPWQGPAAVLAARAAAALGDSPAALDILRARVASLDLFWAGEARRIMARLDASVVERWRDVESRQVDDPIATRRQRALIRTMLLEPDPARAATARARLLRELGLDGEPEQPDFPDGLAARLWSIGLRTEALRWDPSGLPRDTARSSWWTARTELDLGRPWLAISAADTARRQASAKLPVRGLPPDLQRALYPLPDESLVRDAAVRHDVPWSLLAGVAREESRWNPRVLSKVGARGLMQLMPATAVATGTANGRPELKADDLFEPLISLDLGGAELARLVKVFSGNRAAAVAAYNAGEAQAKLWLEQCGDGCDEARFVAGVSFSVTRDYTAAVLGAAAMYEELYPVNARNE